MQKFIIVGAGNRGTSCFGAGLTCTNGKGLAEFRDGAKITGFVDSNLLRAKAAVAEIKLPDLPVFRSVSEAQRVVPADWAIVTTPDFTHVDIVCEAMDAGLNVVVDKPLGVCVRDCDRMIAHMHKTGKKLLVGHNMRYQLNVFEACRRLRAGVIGKIISVEGAEMLDYSHGGDYFHRWHSDFSKSAGLMNHKCCHHLDILNWMLDDEPIAVSAMGGRSFYHERPDLGHGERCSECNIASECPHFFDFDKWDAYRRRLYLDAESEDGYIRDLCCFSNRHTINDHESLNIRYKSGVLASFAMNTYSPREYWYWYFTGTKGRLAVGAAADTGKPYVQIIHRDGRIENVNFERESGEHGHAQADLRLIADLLGMDCESVNGNHENASDARFIADVLGMDGSHPIQKAEPEEARRAILIADMAARSIADGGRCVTADETGQDFPPAPPQQEAT